MSVAIIHISVHKQKNACSNCCMAIQCVKFQFTDTSGADLENHDGGGVPFLKLQFTQLQ